MGSGRSGAAGGWDRGVREESEGPWPLACMLCVGLHSFTPSLTPLSSTSLSPALPCNLTHDPHSPHSHTLSHLPPLICAGTQPVPPRGTPGVRASPPRPPPQVSCWAPGQGQGQGHPTWVLGCSWDPRVQQQSPGVGGGGDTCIGSWMACGQGWWHAVFHARCPFHGRGLGATCSNASV